MTSQSIHVIVNPAAGQDQPTLAILNRVFQAAGADWDIAITKTEDDAGRLAREAAERGAGIVAACGGDGTVMGVACGLIGTATPLGILPSGTANVMSIELGIPGDLTQAAELIVNPHERRLMDVGSVDGRPFLLRVGFGLEASMIAGAARELKDRVGVLAYGVSAVQALQEPQISHYSLTLDGVDIETDGVTCIVANVGSIGQGSLSLAPDIEIDDGWLDVIVLERADLGAIVSVASSVIRGVAAEASLLHWKAREIRIVASPPQPVQVDGEIEEPGPRSMHVIPSALTVITPPRDSVQST